MNWGVMKGTIGVVLLAMLGAWLLLRPQGRESQVVPAAVNPAASRIEQSSKLEEPLTSLTKEMAALRREHDQLTHSLRATEAALNRSSSSGIQSGTPSDVQEEGAAIQTEDEQRVEEERVTATLSVLDLRLGKELDDSGWSQRTEMEMVALLHPDTLEGSHVLSADCRSTLCRVEIEHADASAQSRLIDHLPMEPPFDGEMLIRRIDDDPLAAPRTLVYLARPGYSLLAATPLEPAAR